MPISGFISFLNHAHRSRAKRAIFSAPLFNTHKTITLIDLDGSTVLHASGEKGTATP
jgi:hypothetical protein